MNKKLTLTTIVLSACIISGAYGAFNIISPSARPLGMGNSFTGVADDINALTSNPAGLINMTSYQGTFSYNRIFWGISDLGENFIAVGLPIKGLGSFGLGYYSFSDTLYRESVISLGVAYPVPVFAKSAVGVNVKYLSKAYVANEWTALNPYFTALSVSTFSFGVSFYGRLNSEISFGVFADDINQPNVAVNGSENLPYNVKAGVKYSLDKSTLVSLEGDYRNNEFKLFLGGENSSIKTGNFGILNIRMGGGFGTGSYTNVTAGLGYKFNIPGLNIGGCFDYGFLFPLTFASGSNGTHKFTFTVSELFKEFIKQPLEEKQ